MYYIFLENNGKRVNSFGKVRLHKTIRPKYDKLVSENKVYFPKRFTSDKYIEAADYKLVLVRDKLPGDENIKKYDDYGNIIPMRENYPYTVLDSNDYDVEETFYIYGLKKRFNFIQILATIFMNNINTHSLLKEVFIAHNKIVIIDNLDNFNMIICKNEEDSIRLYQQLKATTIHLTKSILYLGNNTISISDIYQIIKDYTTWPMERIRRLTTRP